MTDLASLRAHLRRCRILFLDFDGVLTDNRVIVSESGAESVICDRSDGLGLRLLRERTGMDVVIVSSERNPVVAARARKLGIPCIQGQTQKLEAIRAELASREVSAADACFIGNDVNDLDCLRFVGIAIGVADAHPDIHSQLDYLTSRTGGHGAVREVCDLILHSRLREAVR